MIDISDSQKKKWIRCAQRTLVICGAAVELRILGPGVVDVVEYIGGATGATAVLRPSAHLSPTVSLPPFTANHSLFHHQSNPNTR